MNDRGESSRLLGVLADVGARLDAEHIPWALVGGLAVSVRCEPRFTRDIDLAVAVTDDEAAEALVSRLTAAGYRPNLVLEHDVLRRLATARLVPPGEPDDGVVVDLLFASSGIEGEICREAERIALIGTATIPVARAGHLIASKLLAVEPDRPQDAADLRMLRSEVTDEERRRARAAVARIEALGANRGRRLSQDLARWLESD